MLGFDPRAWNLLGALALAAPACGGIPTAQAPADHDPNAPDHPPDCPYDDYPPCGQVGEDPQFRCSDYDYDYDYDDHEYYECSAHVECGAGSVCQQHECVDLATPVPECTDTLNLAPAIPLPETADGSVALSAIDVDGDGAAELVVHRPEGLFLLDPVDGTTTEISLPDSWAGYESLAGSFDASTPEDLVVHDLASGELHMLRNDGKGGLLPPTTFGNAPTDAPLAALDLQGDGHLDLYAGGQRWNGDGTGKLQAGAGFEGLHPASPVARLKAVVDAGDQLLGSTPHGVLSTIAHGIDIEPLEQGWYLFPLAVAASDIDGDGLDDALRMIDDGNRALLSVYPSSELVTTAIHFGLIDAHRKLDLVDLDGDGRDEAVGWGNDHVIVYRRVETQTPCFATLDGIGRELVTADFDGDGREELAVSDGSTTRVVGLH